MHANTGAYSAQHVGPYAHVITYMHAYISHTCTEASGQLIYSFKFWLWINYPSHILTEPG